MSSAYGTMRYHLPGDTWYYSRGIVVNSSVGGCTYVWRSFCGSTMRESGGDENDVCGYVEDDGARKAERDGRERS